MDSSSPAWQANCTPTATARFEEWRPEQPTNEELQIYTSENSACHIYKPRSSHQKSAEDELDWLFRLCVNQEWKNHKIMTSAGRWLTFLSALADKLRRRDYSKEKSTHIWNTCSTCLKKAAVSMYICNSNSLIPIIDLATNSIFMLS